MKGNTGNSRSVRGRGAALLLAAALQMEGSGCETVQPVEAPSRPMSVREARKTLAESLDHLIQFKSQSKPVRLLKVNRHGVTIEADGATGVLTFAALGNLSISPANVSDQGRIIPCSMVRVRGALLYLVRIDENHGYAHFEREAAVRFVDAVLSLKKAESAPDAEEAEFEAFGGSATSWLASTERPAMPEEARADKATAEDAFKRKDFCSALFAYGDALDKFPTWPEGQYNAALLAAEVEDYELAARHMRRYLALAPGAKDAAAAKEKYLLWKRKGQT